MYAPRDHWRFKRHRSEQVFDAEPCLDFLYRLAECGTGLARFHDGFYFCFFPFYTKDQFASANQDRLLKSCCADLVTNLRRLEACTAKICYDRWVKVFSWHNVRLSIRSKYDYPDTLGNGFILHESVDEDPVEPGSESTSRPFYYCKATRQEVDILRPKILAFLDTLSEKGVVDDENCYEGVYAGLRYAFSLNPLLDLPAVRNATSEDCKPVVEHLRIRQGEVHEVDIGFIPRELDPSLPRSKVALLVFPERFYEPKINITGPRFIDFLDKLADHGVDVLAHYMASLFMFVPAESAADICSRSWDGIPNCYQVKWIKGFH